MNRNIKQAATSVLTVAFISFFATGSFAQSLSSETLESPEEATEVFEMPYTWEVNMIANSSVLMLMGANSWGNNALGVQLKNFKERGAMRYGLEFYPRMTSGVDPIFRQVVGASANTVTYLYETRSTDVGRLSLGYERSRQGSLGRVYIGADVSGTYGLATANAFLSEEEIATQEETVNVSEGNTRSTDIIGGGIKPFAGLDINVWDRVGINLETKFDFTVSASDGLLVNNDATISKSGSAITFNYFPLLELRLYYRFADAGK